MYAGQLVVELALAASREALAASREALAASREVLAGLEL